jgi:hypothetical protein
MVTTCNFSKKYIQKIVLIEPTPLSAPRDPRHARSLIESSNTFNINALSGLFLIACAIVISSANHTVQNGCVDGHPTCILPSLRLANDTRGEVNQSTIYTSIRPSVLNNDIFSSSPDPSPICFLYDRTITWHRSGQRRQSTSFVLTTSFIEFQIYCILLEDAVAKMESHVRSRSGQLDSTDLLHSA